MRSLLKIFRRIFKKDEKKKVGLVLGSGGSWGFSHIGVLKILEENKIYPDQIVGCSMGAIIGAYYALNPCVKDLEKIALKLTRFNLMRLVDVTIPKTSLIGGKKIRKFIEDLIGDKSFSDTKIPLRIVATDLEKGEEVIFSQGKLIDAIMSSISIPGIFPPVCFNGKILVDGGVINPTPINVLKNRVVDIIIGVDLTMKHKTELICPKIYQTIIRSYDILRNQSTKFNIHEEDNVIIIKPDVNILKSFKAHEIEKLILEGEKATCKRLSEIKKIVR
jgi:NTE family protein